MHKKRWFRTLDDFTLSIKPLNTSNKTPTLLRVINVGNRQIYKGDDRIFFHLYFHETPFEESASFVLHVDYLDVSGILKIPVVLKREQGQLDALGLPRSATREFLLFDYYQLEINPLLGTLTCLYLSLENNKITFSDTDCDPQIEPVLPFVFREPKGIHSESMHYLPLHPDDELLIEQRVADQAQRTPIWFNDSSFGTTTSGGGGATFGGTNDSTRNSLGAQGDSSTGQAGAGAGAGAGGTPEISGSSFGKYACGYWVAEDSIGSEAAAAADILKKQSNMRFGRIYEDVAKLITMHNFPEWHYYECGRIAFHGGGGGGHYDVATKVATKGYSSSPDGLAIIPGQTWSVFPEKTRGIVEDPRRCALEYKMSYMSSKFPDYYIPQLYAEMIALKAAMAVLIRCKRRRQTVNGVVKVVHEAFAYRIMRDPDVEREILENVAFSQSAPANVKLADWVALHRGRYERLANKLREIAEKTPAVPLKIPERLLEEYQARRKELLSKVRGF
jgi:hypothetical protein